MTLPPLIQRIAALTPLLAGADHIDVKTIEGDLSMREFIARMLSYQPGWITFLYRLRWGFVRLLGMKQQGLPRANALRAEDVSLTPGEPAYFFKVIAASPDHYWFAGATESHLTAKLGVVVEPLGTGRKRFYVMTVVHYHRWTGRIYFNVIRPFHHFVVGSMMKAAIKSPLLIV
jgi:hypothetical protein